MSTKLTGGSEGDVNEVDRGRKKEITDMFSQLTDAGWILLFGMAGIFVVMGIIAGSTLLMLSLNKNQKEE